MTGYLIVGIVCLLLGYIMGNKKTRVSIKRATRAFRYHDEDEDLYNDDDDDYDD